MLVKAATPAVVDMKKRTTVFIKKNTSKDNTTLKGRARSSKKTQKNPVTVLGWIARHPRRTSGYRFIPFNKEITTDILIETHSSSKKENLLHKIVRVEVFPGKANELKGRIIEEFDSADSLDFELEFVAECHAFPTHFPEEVLQESKSLKLDDKQSRKDLRRELFVTVDGEDAKDFDDAILVEEVAEGYRLGVSIADVSYFVQKDTALDREAINRGTSIYFPDTVVPMLPEKISNDLCSLRPKEDRYCLTADLLINRQGEIIESEFYPSIICSKARLTYNQVQNIADGHTDPKVPQEVVKMLSTAYELMDILKKRRLRVGGLDLDLPEFKVKTGANGVVLALELQERKEAHRMIENFMIAANESVATAFEKAGVPTVFRIHELPDPLKLETLWMSLKHWGFEFEKSELKAPKDFLQKCLRLFKTHPRRKILQFLLLRSMKQAQYSVDNLHHFGLGSSSYLHFTSPIRRYPDLIVHRLLRDTHFLRKPSRLSYKKEVLGQMALDCSGKEQRAVSAERKMNALKKVRFMEPLIGQKFRAVIVSIKDFGFFIELAEGGVEGLIPQRSLPQDRWEVDPREIWMQGKNSGLRFEIGDEILVQLYDVNRMKVQIDFRYLEHLDGKQSVSPSHDREESRSEGRRGDGKRSGNRRTHRGRRRGRS
jgi:ribonuclease R